MVLLCRNDVTINAHFKTQNWVKHRVWHTDPWPDLAWPKSLTRWPVTRRPSSVSESLYFTVDRPSPSKLPLRMGVWTSI